MRGFCYIECMTTKLPKIRFKYGWLIAGEASPTLNDAWGDGTPLRSHEEYFEVARQYEEWWRPNGDKILTAMIEVLGLQFSQTEIDVYIVPWFDAISDPMILGPAFKTQNEVVNTLTHELLHRLLTENTITDYTYDYLSGWKELFGDLEFNTLVHIPVHAVMKKLYLEDIARPDLLELDKLKVKDNQPYVDAWEYVDKNGHEQIIDKLNGWYRSISS